MINEETIAAISTPPGMGGIAIIRISGEKAFDICEKIFCRPSNKSLSEASNFSLSYGHIADENGDILDEVLLGKMCAPHTYTTEDVAEINCHGGYAAAKSILDLVLKCGARIAEPGEFTKRAFFGGRIDLSQAEAVSDMINTKTEVFSKIAARQISGRLKDAIDDIKAKILTVLSNLEVSIQYPEYDIDELTDFELKIELEKVKESVSELAASFRKGEIYKDGLKTAIVGKPNVGKSMLLNAILNEEKAIVTDIPGTTRDVIDETVCLNGVPVKLLDTAGIRESLDTVEAIGIKRSLKAMEESDLTLFVADAASPLTADDIDIYEKIKDRPHIVVLNKCDEPLCEATLKYFENDKFVLISAKTGKNLKQTEQMISEFAENEPGDILGGTVLVNARHKRLIDNALECIAQALLTFDAGMPVDLCEIDIRNAWRYLGEITGETADEDIVNEIFANFCLGK